MDFINQLQALSSKIIAIKSMIQTEEATKNAMVMPFIQLLGYNVFDPLEVVPELTADVGLKKGEKVDYAILKEGKPIMLFECKKCDADLTITHASQLFRYFHVTESRFGVLTNGITYLFFTDLDSPNKMDEKPFFEFNLLDFREKDVEELKKFAKSMFNIDAIVENASELKYIRAIQQKFANLLSDPPEEFVRLLSMELIGSKRFTPVICKQFTVITKKAVEQFIHERINDRLKDALSLHSATIDDNDSYSEDKSDSIEAVSSNSAIVTTAEELEAFYIIRSILRPAVSAQRIIMRDALSYCAILLDDNNRKPLVRLRFNNEKKLRLGLFNSQKEELQVPLNSLDDIYNFSEQLMETLNRYLSPISTLKET